MKNILTRFLANFKHESRTTQIVLATAGFAVLLGIITTVGGISASLLNVNSIDEANRVVMSQPNERPAPPGFAEQVVAEAIVSSTDEEIPNVMSSVEQVPPASKVTRQDSAAPVKQKKPSLFQKIKSIFRK